MKLKPIVLVFACWCLLTTFYLMVLILDEKKFQTDFTLSNAMIKSMVLHAIMWSMLTNILYIAIIKIIESGRNLYHIASLFIISLMIWLPLIMYIGHASLYFFMDNDLPSIKQVYEDMYFMSLYINSLHYLFLFFLCYGLIYQKHSLKAELTSIELKSKATQLELEFSDMKMQTLQSQLSPHFLYNCLNSISGLIRISEKEKSLNSVTNLGDLLRFSVNASKHSLISLIDEIEFTDKYVELQYLRFGNKFNFILEYNISINKFLCPPFILQTLVENAFVHGSTKKDETNKITGKITCEEEFLIFVVENTLYQQRASSNGLGLALDNLKDRLTLLYNSNFSIKQHSESNQFKTTVKIPIKIIA